MKKGMDFKVFFVFSLLLFLIGCSGADVEEPREANYRTGTMGLEIEFPQKVPTEVYENDQDVRFMVQVNNKGAFPQSDETGFEGYLWVGGYDQNILDVHSASANDVLEGVSLSAEDLEGKSSYNRDGGFTAVDLAMNVNRLPQGIPFYKPKLIFTTTFTYKTIANPIICIDPEPRSTKVREKTCTIGDYSAVGIGAGVGSGLGSQGAPVAITGVEEDVTKDSILFKIHVTDSGDGLLIPENMVAENPNKGYDYRDLNRVRIDDVSAGTIQMSSCKPSIGSELELIDGKGFIFCKLDKSNIQEAYVTPLNVILSYGYTSSEEETIEIFEEVVFD